MICARGFPANARPSIRLSPDAENLPDEAQLQAFEYGCPTLTRGARTLLGVLALENAHEFGLNGRQYGRFLGGKSLMR